MESLARVELTDGTRCTQDCADITSWPECRAALDFVGKYGYQYNDVEALVALGLLLLSRCGRMHRRRLVQLSFSWYGCSWYTAYMCQQTGKFS